MTLKILATLFIVSLTAPKVGISDAWMRPNGEGMNTAVFAKILNNSDKADTLYAVESGLSKVVEIHESYEKDGKMKMRKIDYLVVPAKKTVEMKPGGLHIMLIKLKQDIKKGDKHDLVFKFRKAGAVKVKIPVSDKSPTTKNQ